MVHTASVTPAAMPDIPAAAAWATQRSDFAAALEANSLLPGLISREGISALDTRTARTPFPGDKAKRQIP